MSRVGSGLVALACVALAASFFASVIGGNPPPLFANVFFGVLPQLFLAGVVTFVVLTRFGGERIQTAGDATSRILAAALLVSLLLSLTTLWNDGSYYTVLAPGDAIVFILTLGFFPLKTGPEALARFLPAVVAFGIWFRAKRLGRDAKKGIVSALAAYLALALIANALSWIAFALGASHGVTIAGSEDANRVLVTAQADGYWTRGQVERFFAPLGQQSETSFALIRASVAFFASFLFLAFLAAREIRGFGRIMKRLASRSVIPLAAAMLIGAAIGFGSPAGRGVTISYTNILACLVFLISAVSWLLAWRLMRDLTNLPRDERERPDLPLPSGAASVNDVILLRDASVVVSLFGALLLGWPVFAGFATAYILDVFSTKIVVADARRKMLIRSAAVALLAASLGASALIAALRDAPPATGMLRLVLSVGILIGAERVSRRLELFASSRLHHAAILLGAVACSFLIAGERILWLLFLPVCAAYFVFIQKTETWAARRAFPLYFLLGAVGFLALLMPRLFTFYAS